MTRLRAHLNRVDRASVAGDATGAIICGFIAVKLVDLVPHQLVAEQRWMYTAFAVVAAVIGFVCLAGAVWELVRPEALARKAERQRYEDRIAELDDELNATLDALRESDAKVTQLTNERDDARAELEDVRVDRDGLLTERDELLADTDDAGEWASDLDAQIRPAVIASIEAEPDSRYVSDAVTSFNRQAHDAFLKIGPPPGYGQDTGEAK